MPDNTKNLEKLLKVFNTESIITPAEIEQVLVGILALLNTHKKETESINSETKSALSNTLNQIASEHNSIISKIENITESTKSKIQAEVKKQVEDSNSKLEKICKLVLSKVPENGKDADEEVIVEKVLERIKLPEYKEFVLDGATIVDHLNSLELSPELQIDASHIKNLPQATGNWRSGGSRYLQYMADVKITNIQNNDVLKWNSTTGQFENGVGGGSASAFIDLTDAPNSYTGAALQVVRVNAGETGLEFVTLAGGGDALTSDPLSQFAATTSLQLKGVITDETGSGALVFATSPTLVTPVLGVAVATSINKVVITTPATGSTLTIDDGFTLRATGNVTALSGSHTGTSSGTNTGDQTSIVGITGTKAQFDTAVTDGNFLYVGDANLGATTALDNLASVAINTSLVSDTDSTDNLGSTTVAWANLYVDTIRSITGNPLALTPIGGQSLVISLSTTGDLVVNTNHFYVDTSTAFVGIGTASPQVKLHSSIDGVSLASGTFLGTETFLGSNNGTNNFRLANASDTASTGSSFVFFRSRTTLDAPAIVQSGDCLGQIVAQGWDGVVRRNATEILFESDGTPGSSDMPGRIVFKTTADGASATTSRIIIDSSGAIKPATNDGIALGTSALQFSDLFLASGSVLNIANGDWAATHSSGILTVGTGDLRVTTAGTNTASVVTVGGTQTLTNKTLTSPTLTTPSAFTTGGTITLAENTSIALDPAGSADGKWTGLSIAATAGYTQAFGDLVYLDPTDSRWELVDANSAAAADGDARGILGMVVSAGTDGNACTILLQGVIRADAKFPSFTINNPIYASETAGSVTQTQPTTTDVVIRVVGFALTADEMYFNPSPSYITHT
jgi:hypothetical protein